jgi:putative ABC transport system permease protein
MLFENIRIALSGLFSNRMRTLLSILGILIGVMSVTLLLAVGKGASNYVANQVNSLGNNTVYVFLKDPSTVESSTAKSRKQALTKRDLQVLQSPAMQGTVLRVAPELATTVTVTKGSVSRATGIRGTNAAWAKITNRSVARGLMFSDDDVRARRRVAVVGSTAAKRFFPGQSAVGQTIRLGSANFEVVGVFTRRGGGLEGGDADSVIVVPDTSMEDVITGTFETYAQFIVQMRPEVASVGQERITTALLSERKIEDKAKADFDTFDNASLAATASQISTVFTALLGLIASISLLVGGIGVMNIMLVTVTERTREIGVRKALGARRWHLLTQFLVESVVLTGVGGILGAGIGSALSQIKVSNFAPVLAPWMILLSVGVSALIGVAFGVYPANKAAKLRPIDALRFE